MPYLREAVNSVLAQTFQDFELLLIDDCSTDDSYKVAASFTDPRIRLFRNSTNQGLIFSLNRGIAESRGEFIARMDGDDVCLPERFQKQVAYLRANPGVAVVSSFVKFIDADGNTAGFWPADEAATGWKSIRRILPHENCVAHPSVMMRAEILRKYRYKENQQGSEDYDLWLRLARDGKIIEKVPEQLLLYRVHQHSTTLNLNLIRSPQLRTSQVKWKFIRGSLGSGRVNFFVLRCLYGIAHDLQYHARKRTWPTTLRRFKRWLTVNPIRAAADFQWLKKSLRQRPFSHFFFFSYSHIGGAEMVHAFITRVVKHCRPLIMFTGLHDKGGMIDRFETPFARNIAAALYHPLYSSRTRNALLHSLAQNSETVVFGSNSEYFYNFILQTTKETYCVDLVHDVFYPQNEISRERLAALLRLNTRLFVSNRAANATLEMYKANSVPSSHEKKMRVIYNYCAPVSHVIRQWSPPFKVLYVGRDSREKRVDLVLDLAELLHRQGLPFDFIIAGDVKRKSLAPNVQFHGLILDREKLFSLYAQAHFVIITSESEGFPLSLMEGMAHGSIPLSTPVGDIPFHIRHLQNGLLCKSSVSMEVVEEMGGLLAQYRDLPLETMSANAVAYCRQNFSYEAFEKNYRNVLRCG